MFKKKAVYMGIDVGGTKILVQTYDSRFKVLSEKKVLTQTKKGEKGFTDQLLDLMEQYFTKSIKAIGIAVPGIVDPVKGLLVKAPHLPTKPDYPLKEILEEFFRRPVHVENDINAFLWGEWHQPRLRKYRNIVAVMVGTGLGGAILNDGKLIYGAQGFAGEVGHMIIRQDGPLKTFEQNTSGCCIPRINRMLKAEKEGASDPKVKKYILEHLGIGLSNLNLIFNPEVILVGGSIYRHYLADRKAQLERIIATHALDKKGPRIMLAYSKKSVALGVAMMAAKK